MLSKTAARFAVGLTCLFMIAMPVSAQLGAPGVPAVPGVPAAPELPATPQLPSLPNTPAGDVVTVHHDGTALGACLDARDAQAQAAGHLATVEGHADTVTAQAKDAATSVTGSLPAAPVAHPDTPDATELGLHHCAHADAEDPQGSAMGAAGQAQGFLGTVQGWFHQATSWLPF